jgi:hypothetical protein
MDRLSTFILIILSLFFLPLLTVWLSGDTPSSYLDFPFITPSAGHEAFSWVVWWAMVLFVLVVIIPLLIYAWRYTTVSETAHKGRKFPPWGKLAALLLILFWVLAWNRFSWFASFQLYTFTPLWLCYIVIVNAITFKRKGQCLLTTRPAYLLGILILSSLFWWYYEYLNGFIRNWYYVGLDELSTAEYVVHSTIAYAMVLPSVLSTIELLNTFPKLSRPFANYTLLKVSNPKPWALVSYLGGCAVLGLAAIFPEHLFLVVWIAPLFIIVAIRYLLGQPTLYSSLAKGDWRPLILPALAALICGLFWELWNSQSLAHWQYNIPYVEAYHVFEMPVIGYAGYLPFGLVCLAIAELLDGTDQIFE